MKKFLIVSVLALGLAGCETAYHPSYTPMGDYGFTYDLDNSPSPFVDTSYRPLTAFDLAAPIIVVVTNQPPPRIVYQETPRIGETLYSGESPARATSVAGSPGIIEPAGAQPQPSAAAGAPGVAAGAAPSGYSYGGGVFISPTINNTNTNQVTTNLASTNGNIITNTNGFGMVTNTNGLGGITNTNALAGVTNGAINEPAGTQLQTNRNLGEPPGTQFRTNSFGEPQAPPPRQNNPAPSPSPTFQPPPTRPPQELTPVQPQFRAAPPQRPVAQPQAIQPQAPPASAPLNPPAPQNAPPPQNAPAPQSTPGTSAP